MLMAPRNCWADAPASLEDMKNKVPENMSAAFQLIEDEYLEGPWVMGEEYSVADAYLFTLTRWLKSDGVDPDQFQKVKDHHNRMLERRRSKPFCLVSAQT